MKMFPATSAVLAAEHRLEQSKQQLRQQLHQAWSMLPSALAKPSNLLVVTGIGALLRIWSAHRKTAIAASGAASAWPLVRGTVLALLIRFVMQRVTKRARTDEAKES